MLPKTNLGTFHDRLYLSFVLRLFCYFCNISTVFWWYSFSDHRVGLLCVLFGFVGPISFQLKLETFQTKWRTFICQTPPFLLRVLPCQWYSCWLHFGQVIFFFLSVILFSSFDVLFLFSSYLWDNYRTLLITVLFIRTDRLSCINIRVIIIIIIIIIIF